jgi:serine/threonine protein kinase
LEGTGIVEGNVRQHDTHYSAAVDAYGFGMVRYELLTGFIPFEGHRLSDYELVLSGGRPELPDYLSPEITQLLHKCWHMILPMAWLGQDH